MWKFALAVAVPLLLGAAGVLAVPAGYRVERSVLVAAPPETVLEQLSDLQRWVAWTPTESRDPRISRSYGGRPGSPGATYYWSGGPAVGRGRMTVVGIGPGRLDLELETEAPRRSASDLELRVVPSGSGSRLTWTVLGENGPLDRALWVLSRRHALVRTLEQQLDRFRSATEALPRTEIRRAEATTVVAAPAGALRDRIADPAGWWAWSPWAGTAKGSARPGGAASGVGASLYWPDGERQARMTVVALGPDSVDLELELGTGGPSPRTHDLRFQLHPDGDHTRVTWTASGDQGLEASQLDAGLSRLKSLAEGRLP